MKPVDRAEVASTRRESAGLFQRFVDWTLDHGGQIYGDERERQAWYEGMAVAVSFQLLTMPALFLLVALFCPISGLPFALAVMFAAMLPPLSAYVQAAAKKVDFEKMNWFSAKAVSLVAMNGIPSFAGGLVSGIRLMKAVHSVDAVEQLAGKQGLVLTAVASALMLLVMFVILAKLPSPETVSNVSEE